MDNDLESQFFVYIGLRNETCFGLPRGQHQMNKTQKKLLCKLRNTSILSLCMVGTTSSQNVIKSYDTRKTQNSKDSED